MQFRLPTTLTVRWTLLNPMHFQEYALLQFLLYTAKHSSDAVRTSLRHDHPCLPLLPWGQRKSLSINRASEVSRISVSIT